MFQLLIFIHINTFLRFDLIWQLEQSIFHSL